MADEQLSATLSGVRTTPLRVINEAESMIPRSNRVTLLDALRRFFKDNPGIE